MGWRKASVPKKNTPMLMRAAVLADENEIPDNHVLTVRDRVLSTDLQRIVQNNVKTDTVTLDLDGEWDDCTVYVTFNDETSQSGPWSLQWEGQPLTIPSAIGAVVGPVAVSVVGYGSDGELRLVTEAAPALLNVVKSGYVEIVDDNEENKDILSQMVAAGQAAEDAAEAANAAATSATSAASSANSAASSANTAASSANSAATKANSAAVDAQNAYDTLKPYMATVDSCANILHSEVGPDSVVTADDSFPCKPVEMVVYGNTVQNLWVNPSGSRSGVTITTDQSGDMDLSGTSTGTLTIQNTGDKIYSLRPGEEYTISCNREMPSSAAFGLREYDSEGNAVGSKHNATLQGTTFTTQQDMAYTIARFDVDGGVDVSGTYRIMLNEGSTAEPWCPPGLNSVGDDGNVQVVTAGKNLRGKMIPGYNIAVSIGATYPSDSSALMDFTGCVGGETYTAHGDGIKIGTFAWYRDASEGSYIGNSGWNSTTWTPLTAAAPSGARYMRVGIDCNATMTQEIADMLQLELGSTATSYEPPNITTTPINLQGHTLNALPDGTRDELHIDGGGNVVLEKRTGAATAPTAAGGWTYDAAGSRSEFTFNDATRKFVNADNGMCDKLPMRLKTEYAMAPNYVIADGRRGYVKNPAITSTATAATVAGGMTVLYPLLEPQTIDLGTITPPTMAAPNVTAYVADDTPAEMSLDYVRDVNIVHTRLEERVAALELASATS